MSKELKKRIFSSLLLIPLTFFLIIDGSYLFNIFLSILFLLSLYEWNKICKNKLLFFFGAIFLFFSFFTVFVIRNYFNGDYLFFLFVLLICISTDTGGYIFGKTFKGPKLTSISPNKTFSGAIGGYICSVLIIYIFLKYINYNTYFEFTYEIIISVILISTISQAGDITISYFKRLFGVKNTGEIIPGHGGILDRIDGMIFAFPFTYVLLTLNMFNFIK
tara:strand:+ start:1253 stop:1909 length:657 start_codon:yes stop_codon:yes gene_type:complete